MGRRTSGSAKTEPAFLGYGRRGQAVASLIGHNNEEWGMKASMMPMKVRIKG